MKAKLKYRNTLDEFIYKFLQPFFTTIKGTDGTGLRLSITNDIVKAHGGRITIDLNQTGRVFKLLYHSEKRVLGERRASMIDSWLSHLQMVLLSIVSG